MKAMLATAFAAVQQSLGFGTAGLRIVRATKVGDRRVTPLDPHRLPASSFVPCPTLRLPAFDGRDVYHRSLVVGNPSKWHPGEGVYRVAGTSGVVYSIIEDARPGQWTLFAESCDVVIQRTQRQLSGEELADAELIVAARSTHLLSEPGSYVLTFAVDGKRTCVSEFRIPS